MWQDGRVESDQQGQNASGGCGIPPAQSRFGQPVARLGRAHCEHGAGDGRENGRVVGGGELGGTSIPAEGGPICHHCSAGIAVTRSVAIASGRRTLLAGRTTLARVRENIARAQQRRDEQAPASQEDGHYPLHIGGMIGRVDDPVNVAQITQASRGNKVWSRRVPVELAITRPLGSRISGELGQTAEARRDGSYVRSPIPWCSPERRGHSPHKAGVGSASARSDVRSHP